MTPTHGRISMMYELANYEQTVDLRNTTLSHWFVLIDCVVLICLFFHLQILQISR